MSIREEGSGAGTLSPRELDVLRCAAYGLTVQGTALRMGIGCATVRTHRTNILIRMEAASITEAVYCACVDGRLALSSGLLMLATTPGPMRRARARPSVHAAPVDRATQIEVAARALLETLAAEGVAGDLPEAARLAAAMQRGV